MRIASERGLLRVSQRFKWPGAIAEMSIELRHQGRDYPIVSHPEADEQGLRTSGQHGA